MVNSSNGVVNNYPCGGGGEMSHLCVAPSQNQNISWHPPCNYGGHATIFACVLKIEHTFSQHPTALWKLITTPLWSSKCSLPPIPTYTPTLFHNCWQLANVYSFSKCIFIFHERVMWPGLYRKLIWFPRIVVWHMRVSTGLLEVTWL